MFEEYGVTPAEVERTAKRELAAIRMERKAGKLKPWKPAAKPRRNLVEYLDKFVGLVKRDTEMIEPLKLK